MKKTFLLGFSEHLELELMVQAGLKPMEAITAATRNAARVLEIDSSFGTLTPGRRADFIILDANPADDIKNTRKILAVYKAGKQVSKGPLQQ
jgi:imidazolonepropionase-like amidohydrolase